jgi:glucose-1-phosphate cytidylyltransferase
LVTSFIEKPNGGGGAINGGFFVLRPECLDYIKDDQTSWEFEPLVKLSQLQELMAYKHKGFWQAMDTLRDKMTLEDLWSKGKAPWKTWN